MKKLNLISIVSLVVLTLVCGNMKAQPKERKVNIITYHETYVSDDQNKENKLFGDRKTAGGWEVFTIVDLGNGKVNIKASNGKFVTLGKDGELYAKTIVAQENETFTVVKINENWVGLKAANGKYVTSDKDKKTLIANRDNIAEWESFNLVDVK
jgi:hypothetical protein